MARSARIVSMAVVSLLIGVIAIVALTLIGGSAASDVEPSDVVQFEGIEQLRTVFNDDVGHPRLILLVDPI